MPYYGISSGKLRRYFDPKNFSDPFKVLKGYHQSVRLLKKLKPDVVFSKALSPCQLCLQQAAAIFLRSSMNRISRRDLPTALQFQSHKSMLQFPGDTGTCSGGKAVLTGTPIRAELLSGDADRAFALCNFTDSAKPTLLVVGGSSGSRAINTAIRDLLPELIKNYNVIHLCGKEMWTLPERHRQLCPV